MAALACLASDGCRRGPPTIAVIPRTCGTNLWEPFHSGAAFAAHEHGLHIYWNAPTQDNDVLKQIGFLQLALDRHYRAVVVAPDETLAFRTPVRMLLDHHIPVVVVDDDLRLPRRPNLSYVVNDETAGGRIAARRLAAVLHGKGSVALLGIDPRMESIVVREQSFEETLASEAPGIRIALREYGGDLNVPHEQQIAEQVLHRQPRVDAIVALSASATRGAYYAKVESGGAADVPLIGFDQDLLTPIVTGEIDSVVVQNAPEIGRLAIQNVEDSLQGRKVPQTTLVEPALLTRDNLDAPLTHRMWHGLRFPWSEQ